MTMDRFRAIVLKLGNQMFVRHYLWLNAPRDPQMMAIQFHGAEGDRLISELRDLGFREAPSCGKRMWVVERRES